MSEKRRVFNPGPGEVVFCSAGGVLAAHESIWTDPSDRLTAHLLDNGVLLTPVEPEKTPEAPAEPEPKKKAPAHNGKGDKTGDK